MFFPNDEDWRAWGISHEAHKFFLLRWHELFDEHTFDAWQVRSSNIKSILSEILNAIDIVKDVHAYHPNIRSLIDEAIQIAKEDIIIKNSFAFVLDYLNRLGAKYDANVKNERNLNLDAFRSHTLVILGTLNNYRNKLLDYIDKLISAPPEKFKILLYGLIMSLGVELKLAGYSISSLRDSIKILQNNAEPNFQQRFRTLKESFSGISHEYECYFFISYQPDTAMNLDDHGIVILNNKPIKEFSDEEIKFYEQDAGACILIIKVNAPDEYSARYNAEKKLESFFAVSRLYQGSKTTKIKHPLALIRNLETDKYQCICEDITRLQYIKDANQPTDNIVSLIRLLNSLTAQDAGQLNGSLQHHKLALSASTDDARLINLWIALESLVIAGRGNIIERLTKYVSATNTTNYTYRMLRALAIDMKSLWVSSDKTTLISSLHRSNPYFLHLKDLLSILVDKRDGSLITGFLSLTSVNILLTFRVFRLWENIFSGPSGLSNHLEKHKQIVEWQIRRIYRARNHIIHQGAYLSGTRQLIQHLHTYYIITINNLVHDLLTHPGWNIEDALEHRLIIYEHFQDCLNNHNIKPIPQDSILNHEKILFPAGLCAWQDEKSKI